MAFDGAGGHEQRLGDSRLVSPWAASSATRRSLAVSASSPVSDAGAAWRRWRAARSRHGRRRRAPTRLAVSSAARRWSRGLGAATLAAQHRAEVGLRAGPLGAHPGRVQACDRLPQKRLPSSPPAATPARAQREAERAGAGRARTSSREPSFSASSRLPICGTPSRLRAPRQYARAFMSDLAERLADAQEVGDRLPGAALGRSQQAAAGAQHAASDVWPRAPPRAARAASRPRRGGPARASRPASRRPSGGRAAAR